MTAKLSDTILSELPPTTRGLDISQIRLGSGGFPRGASKAAALRWLLERWGIPLDEVIAFGDDVNDVEMIDEARAGGGDGQRRPGGQGGGQSHNDQQ